MSSLAYLMVRNIGGVLEIERFPVLRVSFLAGGAVLSSVCCSWTTLRAEHRLTRRRRKEAKTVDEILGWSTAGGLGMLLAGLGVFFWGLQFLKSEHWQRRRRSKEE